MTAGDRWAYLAEGNRRQARKRVAADVLIQDEHDRVLLVDPKYKKYWDLPGGMAEANEPPRAAAERELREELGLVVPVGRVLLVDWDGPHGPWDDQLVFVFETPRLPTARAAALRTCDDELAGLTWVPPREAGTLLRADMADRLHRALQARRHGHTGHAERHHPPE